MFLQINLIFFTIFNSVFAIPQRIPIQTFTTSLDDGLKPAIEFTLDKLNSAMPRKFLLQHRHKLFTRLPADNGWAMMENVCAILENPGYPLMLLGEWRLRQHTPFWLVSAGMEMPMINWELSPKAFENGNNDFEVSIRPPNAQFLADLILLKNWRTFIFLHDWENGEKAVQILRQMAEHWRQQGHKGGISHELVQLPKHSAEYGLFLKAFFKERQNLNLNKGKIRVILDAANPYRQQKLLQTLTEPEVLKNKTNVEFIVANFDFLPSEVDLMQKANLNIVGGQLVDRNIHGYGQLARELENSKLFGKGDKLTADLEVSRLAFVHDALLIAKATFSAVLERNESFFADTLVDGQFHNYGLPGILCHSRNKNRPARPFELGKAIAKTMNWLNIDSEHGTLTGHIEFDANGIRKNFDVKIIELGSDETSHKSRNKHRIWRHSTGFLREQKPALRSIRPTNSTLTLVESQKRPIRVVTVRSDPFVMLKPECEDSGGNQSECGGNDKFEGYCIDLLKLLSSHIVDFHYEIFLADGNRYGAKQADGSYDGMIGHLLRGEADLAVASLTINQERERVIDFSQPFMTTGISIMILKPDRQEFSLLRFMAPLSQEVWLCIMLAFIGVSIVIYFAARCSPFEFKSEEEFRRPSTGIYRPRRRGSSNDGWTVFNSLWFTWAALLGGGGDMSPRSLSVRIASSTWFFFTLIMISSYTANLAAFLTIERMSAPIESVEDLAKQTKIKYGIQQGGSTALFFKYSSVQIYQHMWKFMEDQVPSVFVNSYAEGIERVRSQAGRYAFLLESTANEYANMRQPCNTMKIGENLNSIGYGVATPFGSELKDHINLAILALQETGELRKLRNKWWHDRGQCNEEGGIDSSTESLTLRNVAGVFYVLIGGMVLALLVAFVERIYRQKMQRRGLLVSNKEADHERNARNSILMKTENENQG